jgi:hypothetical protein
VLDSCFNGVLGKLFGTYSKAILHLTKFYTGCLPISHFLDLYSANFVTGLAKLIDVNFVISSLFRSCESWE